MKREDSVDYFLVPDRHLGIHERLEAWARWVRVRPTGWQVAPMFRQYRSKAWQWHRPEPRQEVNIPEAMEMERSVSLLPAPNRDAVRWCYVFCGNPTGMAQSLGVTRDGLRDLVSAGRDLLLCGNG